MKVDKFGVDILVGSKPLKEYTPPPKLPGRCLVAYSLHDPSSFPMDFEESDPFGETYTQKWPVTPYEVRVSNDETFDVWATVVVDGRGAGSVFVPSRGAAVMRGFRVTDERGRRGTRQFLFSMPRQMRSGETVALRDAADVATIKVCVREAVFSHEEDAADYDRRQAPGRGHDAVNKHVAKLAKSGSVSRAGEATYEPARTRGSGATRIYKFGEAKATLVFDYCAVGALAAKGVDVDEDEPPEPSWWAAAFGGLRGLLGRWLGGGAPAPAKRKRDDDAGGPSKKPATDADDDDDDDDIVDLTEE